MLEYDRPHKSDLHPTMKPVALLERLLGDGSPNGSIILDPFGGSGSTLIACEASDRVCRMVELDPAYVDVVVERWQHLTGGKAERLHGDTPKTTRGQTQDRPSSKDRSRVRTR